MQDHQVIEFFKQLSNAFNVHVRNIEAGRTASGDECTIVTVDEKTPADVIDGLPKKYARTPVEYKTSGPVGVPGCGQPGHQCACGAPKP